jgi:hypothetical protein
MRLCGVVYVPADDCEKRTHYEIFSGCGLWRTRLVADSITLIEETLRELVKPLPSPYWSRGSRVLLLEH